MKVFTVGNEPTHRVGDAQCPECWEAYPEPCPCGGLMHAAGSEEGEGDRDMWLATLCDRCGRSEDAIDIERS
jgi:hypothetical protein